LKQPALYSAGIVCQSGIAALAKPTPSERAQRDAAVADAQPHGAVRVFVQVGVRGQEALLLVHRQRRHAVHVVVAVALDMRDAQQVDQARSCCTDSPACVVRSSAERKKPAPGVSAFQRAQRAAFSSDLYKPLQVLLEMPV
jgi:hypothetical protein